MKIMIYKLLLCKADRIEKKIIHVHIASLAGYTLTKYNQYNAFWAKNERARERALHVPKG